MSDPIAILEMAYDLEGSESQWLQRVVETTSSSLGDGQGVCGWTYDVNASDACDVRNMTSIGVDPRMMDAGLQFDRTLPDAVRRTVVQVYRTGFVGNLTAAPDALRRAGLDARVASQFQRVLDEFVRGWSFTDGFWINAQDPTRIGCLMSAPMRVRRRSNARNVHQWRCVAAHVATAFRIRRQFAEWSAAAPGAAPPRPEAVLRPDGRLEHAEGTARDDPARVALRRAVRAFDRARGALRRHDPDEAISIWRALVAGRWSLVDHFDSDGRRYVVAHRNDANVPDARGLTLRERQVMAYAALGHANKVIAYELGLAPSTVAGHLARAHDKLRLPSIAAINATPGNAGPERT